jgi:putative transposase
MPWYETEPMNEKVKFITTYKNNKHQMTFKELCEEFNISCKTGYKYIKRYASEGVDGLKERSRAPRNQAKRMSLFMEESILEVKLKYPTWGAKKVRNWLLQEQKEYQWPAKSTIDDLFKRHKLVSPAKRKRRVPPYSDPLQDCNQSNDCWSIDYKGQFLLGNKELCYPLTITDNFSRYLLAVEGSNRISAVTVQTVLTQLFIEFGLPLAVRSDNGSPFAGNGLGGLSKIAVWLIKLGIVPERIRKGHPEENGRHERMHLTLKKETASPAKWNQTEQQNHFNEFKKIYNEERPHEGIDFQRPIWLFTQSSRNYPNKIPKNEYDSTVDNTRKIRTNGTLKWLGKEYFVSETLVGETIGMKQKDDGEWLLFYSFLPIGIFSEKTYKVRKLC